LFKSELPIPFDHFSDYTVPQFVDKDTLAIVVSTSGNTEETLSSYNELKNRTEMVFVITTGGELGKQAQEDGYPIYLIDDKEFNPSHVPRVAVGFQIGAYFALLSKLKLISMGSEDFADSIYILKEKLSAIAPESPTDENPAKLIATDLQNRFPIIVSSEHLSGTAKLLNNQINESGKTISANFELPDVNHHQLEGMQFPESNPKTLLYVLVESNLYHERNQERYAILKNLLDDLGIEHISLKPESKDTISQALEVIQFSGYVTYYLGLLNGVEPAPNPFVDEFKRQLG
ncbi:hypothetical protein KC717_06925, partial [Candidatus Dojkabacteria bacterium]|nr:hypothetical protein [Candidatus Dojkabacteria bacterium]